MPSSLDIKIIERHRGVYAPQDWAQRLPVVPLRRRTLRQPRPRPWKPWPLQGQVTFCFSR